MIEAVYFGTYALFFGLAAIFLGISLFFKFNQGKEANPLAGIVFPLVSAIIWFIVAVLSFAVYTDATTVWVQWPVALVCGVFGILGILITLSNVGEMVENSGKILVEDSDQ